MCEVLDKIVKEGELRGEVRAYSSMGMSTTEIAEHLNMSIEDVEKVIASLN